MPGGLSTTSTAVSSCSTLTPPASARVGCARSGSGITTTTVDPWRTRRAGRVSLTGVPVPRGLSGVLASTNTKPVRIKSCTDDRDRHDK